MRVRKLDANPPRAASGGVEDISRTAVVNEQHSEEFVIAPYPLSDKDAEKFSETRAEARDAFLDFSNSRLVIGLAYTVWCVLLVANAYAIAMLLVRWAK